MFVSEAQTRRQTSRLIGAALLLFVFFLPLHFHFASSARVAQECACVQGARTQLAPIAALPTYTPIVIAQAVVVESTVPRSVEWPRRQCVRAPPVSPSV